MNQNYPSADAIRQNLLIRANRYMELTGRPRSVVSKAAVNDPAFLSQVESGRNITLELYQRTMDWLDANWPVDATQSSPELTERG